MRIRRQVAAFVRTSAGDVRLAVWTAWESRGHRRCKVMVFRVVRTILPRDHIGHAVEKSASDVTEEHLEAWLESRGYELVSRLDGPEQNDKLSLW